MNHLFLESNELEYADENATIKENKNLSNNDALNISNTQMDPEYSQIIIQKLQNVMSQEKLYLFHDLNLDTVAQRISVPRHHISNVLNKSLNTNFFDYINKFRVEEAKRKIKDETLKNYTLIALGSDAGFNSKASFYRNFKRYENMTPLEYKQLIDSNK
jgi:AraC-like DNA-binding protein